MNSINIINNTSTPKILFLILMCFLGQIIIPLIIIPFAMLELNNIIKMLIVSILYIITAFLYLHLLTTKSLNLKLSNFRINFNINKTNIFNINWFCAISGLLLVLFVVISYILFVNGELVLNNLSSLEFLDTFVQTFFFIGIATSIVEEFLFRGVALKLIEIKWGSKWAIIIPAIIWAIFHIITSNFTDPYGSIIRVISVTYVGIIFSIITLKTNTIWHTVFLHFIWNYTTTGVIHISTAPSIRSPINFILQTDNILLTGSSYGIDSSIISMTGFSLLLIAYLFKYKNIKI